MKYSDIALFLLELPILLIKANIDYKKMQVEDRSYENRVIQFIKNISFHLIYIYLISSFKWENKKLQIRTRKRS